MKLKKLGLYFLAFGILSLLMFSCSKNFSFTKPKCLAVGSARSVMIAEVEDVPGTYKVIVRGSNPSTVILTQRPKRSSKVVDTKAFLDQWDKSFKSSAPNVTFTSVSSSRTTSNVLVISNPIYDEDANTITFDGKALSFEETNVEPGIYNNVTISYDSQIQNMIYDAVPSATPNLLNTCDTSNQK